MNLALATGNVGRPRGGCVRLGGHQEGYVRPSDAHVGRPAAYVDRLLIEGKGGVHHIWGCDHYKTTLNALEFKRVYKRRTDLVKDAMNGVAYGDRAAMVDAIMGAIRQGGLFAVDVDIVPTQIGQACHVWLPAATSGEMNLTSMNGERRMRLTERYMDPPGSAMPDCLIAARIANHLERVLRGMGDDAYADKFQGFDWRTEEDAFMDGYHLNAKGGEHVTYERLRAMGTNGFQEPAVGFEEGGGRARATPARGSARASSAASSRRRKAPPPAPPPPAAGGIVGTKRLYADGKFGTEDGKATFMAAQVARLQAPGKEEQKAKFPFLINNGRANHVWQSAYLDVEEELVMDRWPYPFLEMHAEDMAELGSRRATWSRSTTTRARPRLVQPSEGVRRKEAFMLFAYPTGVQGNVVNAGVNELVIPNYKQTWGDIRSSPTRRRPRNT